MSEEQKLARDAALESLPPELREALLRKASDLGVHRADDVVWALVASVINATVAAQVAGEHVKTLAQETRKVPDMIYQGAVRAGADLAAGVAKSIESKTVEAGQALVQAIGVAASRGAVDLQKAAAGLDRLGQEKGALFVEQWKAAVAVAVEKQARAALKNATLRNWLGAVFGLGMMMVVGAGIAVGAGLALHKIILTRGIEVRGRGVDAVFVINRRVAWEKEKWCRPRGAACLSVLP